MIRMTVKLNQSEASRSPRSPSVGFCLLWFVVSVSLTACGPKNYTNENDKLRAERMTLQQQIDELQSKLALREGELRATREQLGDPLPPVEGIEPPRLAGIVLGLYSGPIDQDGDSKYDALRVYVRPVDQHSRQITAKGTARVRLISTPADGEPVTILDQSHAPDAFHAAYRSGVTGTHYTLKAELPDDRPTSATLHVSLTDAATGRVFKAQKQITLVRTTSP